MEPDGANTVLKLDLRNISSFIRGNNQLRTRLSIRKEFIVVIENVEDFQIRGDFMFAVKKRVRITVTREMLPVKSLIRFRV